MLHVHDDCVVLLILLWKLVAFRGHGEFLCNLDVIIFSFPYLNRKLWKRINTTDVINLGKRERENPK